MSLMGPDGQPLGPKSLIGPDGRPLGIQDDTAGPIEGLQYGFAFLMMEDDVFGFHPLEPVDVNIVDVRTPDGLPPLQYIAMLSRPLPPDVPNAGSHRYVRGWRQVPSLAAQYMAARMSASLGIQDEGPPEPVPEYPDGPG